MEQKSIAFIVVALVIGAALGVGIGSMVFGGDSEDVEQTTWWIYIDYADEADETHKTGWYSAKAANINDAAKEMGIVLTETGWLEEINGVEADWQGKSQGWNTYLYNGTMISSNLALGNMYSTVALVLLNTYDPVTYETVLDPNTSEGHTEWMGTGPFAA